MADLELTLSWLDMSQYLERFVRAGFDSWKTMLEITENDLEMLDVRLGHRRKLQREITNTKRLADDPAIVTPLSNQISQHQEGQAPDLKDEPPHSSSSKQGYRRHPMPDLNAPERPYSGYVMFSNDVHEQLKDTSPSLIDISRQVELSWQSLPSLGKEHWKTKAAALWLWYKVDVTEYRKTDKYQDYMEYLAKFRASHVTQNSNRPHESRRSPDAYSIPGRSPTVGFETFGGPPFISSTRVASPPFGLADAQFT